MSIDLTTAADVRAWLAVNSGLPNNAAQTSVVNTTSTSAIPSGTQVVTPVSMANILVGSVLGIDSPVTEYVSVVSPVTGTTFTATFALAHSTTPVAITDQTDLIISRLITAASAYILRRTRRVNADGSIPTTSTFSATAAFNEWYDGNGNYRMFLRYSPIVSVQALTVNGITIPASTGFSSPGYVIDQSGRSLVLRSATPYQGGSFGSGTWYVNNFGPIYNFARGIQNINVQYTAGFTSIPYDLADACIQMVGYTYRSRGWIGQQQAVQAENVGTIQYVKWTIPPMTEEVIRRYTPASIV